MRERQLQQYGRCVDLLKLDKIVKNRLVSITVERYDVNNERLNALAEGVVGLANLIIFEKADTLVLLDKSARPVAQLFKAYWRHTYPKHKIPEIRFIDIGLGDRWGKDDNPKYLKQLYDAHHAAINGKRVIIADEAVCSGGTIRKAKKIFETNFPKASKFVYTAVFEFFPTWYGKAHYLGVYDMEKMPFDWCGDVRENFSQKEPDTFIAKSLSGILRRNPHLRMIPFLERSTTMRQKDVNAIRKELSYIGKKTAETAVVITVPGLPDNHNFKSVNTDHDLNG
jgi:hypoxanthine phosphoribosyltransferase